MNSKSSKTKPLITDCQKEELIVINASFYGKEKHILNVTGTLVRNNKVSQNQSSYAVLAIQLLLAHSTKKRLSSIASTPI
jgi:hypothetical protein